MNSALRILSSATCRQKPFCIKLRSIYRIVVKSYEMGKTALLLRRKPCYRYLSPLKVQRPQPGLNPRILGPTASTLPLYHQGRLIKAKNHVFYRLISYVNRVSTQAGSIEMTTYEQYTSMAHDTEKRKHWISKLITPVQLFCSSVKTLYEDILLQHIISEKFMLYFLPILLST
jgi:hypothetical protein